MQLIRRVRPALVVAIVSFAVASTHAACSSSNETASGSAGANPGSGGGKSDAGPDGSAGSSSASTGTGGGGASGCSAKKPDIAGVYLAQLPYSASGDPAHLYTAVFGSADPGPGFDPNHLTDQFDGMSTFLPWNAIDVSPKQGCDWSTADSAGCYAYDWSTFDSALVKIHGLVPKWRLNVLVEPAAEGTTNNMTPAYVLGKDYATWLGVPQQRQAVCANYPGTNTQYGSAGCMTGCSFTSDTNISGAPVFVDKPFKTAYQAFITAFTQHFSPTCNAADCAPTELAGVIGYVRFGMGLGSEVDPLCNSNWPTDANFPASYIAESGDQSNTYLYEMTRFQADAVKAACDDFTLVFNIHKIGNDEVTAPDLMAADAVDAGYGFGNNGLRISDTEPDASCVAQWCENAAMYGSEVPITIQTFFVSAPNGMPGYDDNAGQRANQDTTGPLDTILPFAKKKGVTVYELYPCDALFAYARDYGFDASTGFGLPNVMNKSGSPGQCSNGIKTPMVYGAYSQTTWLMYGGGKVGENPYQKAIQDLRDN
jgi:hypothetical protein